MINNLITLVYDWSMGVIMIGVFALVCIILIGILVNFMTNKNKGNDIQED